MSLKFRTEFHYVTANTTLPFKVKGLKIKVTLTA